MTAAAQTFLFVNTLRWPTAGTESDIMATPNYKVIGHLNPSLSDGSSKSLDASRLTGRWLNTSRETGGIAECLLERSGDRFKLTLLAVGSGEQIPWPEVEVTGLANLEEEAGQRAYALAAEFDHGFMRSRVYIRVNKGVLVIVLFNSFSDQSGRSDYVTREFFYRAD
jgi:hypothetical protein